KNIREPKEDENREQKGGREGPSPENQKGARNDPAPPAGLPGTSSRQRARTPRNVRTRGQATRGRDRGPRDLRQIFALVRRAGGSPSDVPRAKGQAIPSRAPPPPQGPLHGGAPGRVRGSPRPSRPVD